MQTDSAGQKINLYVLVLYFRYLSWIWKWCCNL